MRMNRWEWLGKFFRPQIAAPRNPREKRARKKERVWDVTADGRTVRVAAHTKSEARARAKALLEIIGRLPVGTRVVCRGETVAA